MTEHSVGIGNELNAITQNAMTAVFLQGELAQLSHTAFDHIAISIRDNEEDEFTVNYPIGYKPTKEPMIGASQYNKQDLINRYSYLANTQMPMNGIYQLSTIIEAMLADLIRRIILEYPHKLSAKRQVSVRQILSAQSIAEMRIAATDGFLRDLSYKAPREFAEEVAPILSINLLECPAYHTYIEMKATRDILIHNRGVANDIYTAKAGSHARVTAGMLVPVSQVYLLEVYEACLQLIEWLEDQLHQTWHSSDHVSRKAKPAIPPTTTAGDA